MTPWTVESEISKIYMDAFIDFIRSTGRFTYYIPIGHEPAPGHPDRDEDQGQVSPEGDVVGA